MKVKLVDLFDWNGISLKAEDKQIWTKWLKNRIYACPNDYISNAKNLFLNTSGLNTLRWCSNREMMRSSKISKTISIILIMCCMILSLLHDAIIIDIYNVYCIKILTTYFYNININILNYLIKLVNKYTHKRDRERLIIWFFSNFCFFFFFFLFLFSLSLWHITICQVCYITLTPLTLYCMSY